ncbi:GNAT family N-acetyltransferase [Paenibacillus pabuli]|uniref:GNAT family N-acetyltransferase n=1 Tax=Paenibacillus pabuli TaxID=1472 RepID=UPI002045A51B|nr:GNAT family N-acetyltransferase [Paenibacillus pabuli]
MRCYLNEVTQNDFEDVVQIYTNEQVRKYLGGIIPEEHTHAKFLDTLNRNDKTDSFYWVVRLKKSNQFIGLVSLDKHIDGGTELSYEFLPSYWGQGLASEVTIRVIKYAFAELGISKLLAETQIANLGSCKLLERVGMKIERTIQRFGAEQGIFLLQNDGVSLS